MAVAFGTAGTASAGTTKVLSLSLAKPASLAVGNLMVMVLTNAAPAKWICPAGWQALTTDTAGSDVGGGVFVKFATTADVAASTFAVSYTTSNATAYAAGGAIVRYTGVGAVTAMNTTLTSTAATTSPALPTPAGATGTDLVVGVYTWGADATGTSRTLTYPSTGSWNQRVKVGPTAVASTYNCGAMLVDKFGATDTPTATASSIGTWLLVALKLSPTAPTNPSPRRNDCPNPSVANDTTGWGTNGTGVTIARQTGLSGFSRTTGMRATVTAAQSGTGISMESPRVVVSPGEVWAGSAEVAVNSAGNGKPVAIYMNFINSSGSFLTPCPATKVALSTTPQTVVFYGCPAPAGAAFADMQFFTSPWDVAVGYVYDFGSVMMEEIYLAQPFFDGDSSGWTWEGAQGNSSSRQYFGPPPGNWLPFMAHHNLDPELPCTLVTPKRRLWYPGQRPRHGRRVLDVAPAVARLRQRAKVRP